MNAANVLSNLVCDAKNCCGVHGCNRPGNSLHLRSGDDLPASTNKAQLFDIFRVMQADVVLYKPRKEQCHRIKRNVTNNNKIETFTMAPDYYPRPQLSKE